jgi:hypothetical protein
VNGLRFLYRRHEIPNETDDGNSGWTTPGPIAMSLLIVLSALVFLMFVAYRGLSANQQQE